MLVVIQRSKPQWFPRCYRYYPSPSPPPSPPPPLSLRQPTTAWTVPQRHSTTGTIHRNIPNQHHSPRYDKNHDILVVATPIQRIQKPQQWVRHNSMYQLHNMRMTIIQSSTKTLLPSPSSLLCSTHNNKNNKNHIHNNRLFRAFASASTKKKHPFENTFGVTFTISPDQAMDKFLKWAQIEQGLNTYLMNPTKIQIVAAYCPVWSFDLNVRFIVTNTTTGRKRLDWKPELFQSVYGTQSIVHLPGLSAYAGYTYRRTLIDPLHNTTLVFLYDKVVPFGAWMLRDMKMTSTNATIPVVPDPWNAPPGRALSVVKDGLESLVAGLADDEIVRVHAEVVTSRRVYMPTYVITYYILGMEYVFLAILVCDMIVMLFV